MTQGPRQPSQVAVVPCDHCGTPVELPEPTAQPAYCCTGCELAARIIRGAGLEKYYSEREALPPRPTGEVGSWVGLAGEPTDDGARRVNLCVDGLQCASCVWVTEEVLRRTRGVRAASVSYATGRATIEWDPGLVDLATVAGRIAALGYRPRPTDAPPAPDRDLLLRLGVAVFCTINVMMLSISIYLGWWSGMADRYAALFRWSMLTLSTPVALWSAAPFFRAAAAGLRHRLLHIDLPVSLAVGVLYVHGMVSTLQGRDGYLDSLTMLVTLLLAGRLLEQRGRRRTADAALALASEAPRSARRRGPSGPEVVAVEALVPGDILELASGEEVAADGRVTEGAGHVKLALVTGEAEPQPLLPGDRVVAGAVVIDGSLAVSVDAVGGDTVLGKMAAALRASTETDPRAAAVGADPVDRLAPWFTAGTLLAASATLVGQGVVGGLDAGMKAAVAVLVVACPCALALSRPLSVASGLGASARRGLLLRSGDALARLAEVDLIALDKTGTVTGGHPVVVATSATADGESLGIDDAQVLRIAAALERHSIHPVARAVVDEARARGVAIPLGQAVREEIGIGVAGEVDGARWRLERGAPGQLTLRTDGGVEAGRIELRDIARPDSLAAVARLRRRGARVVLVTGDRVEVGRAIAEATGIEEVVAETGPAAKAAWIAERQSEGHRVLFVGDGLNDGQALATAHVGIAMATGAASSILAADGVVSAPALGARDPGGALTLRSLEAGLDAAQAARVAVRRNVRRSIAYNLVAVAAAAAGWINPLVAAVAMPLSSAMVLAGSRRVEREVARSES